MPTQPHPELLEEYKERVISTLREKHGYKNVHEIPKVAKVVVNCSVGAGADSKEALDIAKSEIGLITGQRPVPTLSRRALPTSNFEKAAIGAKVTLRGRIMRIPRAVDQDVASAHPRLSRRFDEVL